LRQTFADGDAHEMELPTRPLRVLVADDHPRNRHSFRQDLEAAGIEVCAEAATCADAVRAAVAEQPDLCLLDVRLPGDDGIAAAKLIRRSLPGVKILLITAFPGEDSVVAAARAGADGYLDKNIGSRRLPHVVRVVAQGETSYPRRLLHPVLRALRSPERSEN
jgi:DNA-binding NarL/FixJ family response regulator